jgi:hypothetical protein
MTRLAVFLHKSRADQRALLLAAALHVIVAIAVRVRPFGQVRRLLAAAAEWGPRPAVDENAEARIVRAVQTMTALLPGGNCLTEALVAQCLLARHRRETTLCFGLSSDALDGRPFDAHAWLEHRGATVIGARAIAYDPLRSAGRCEPSLSSR